MKPFRITVPATSANLGAGFDSIGLAINQYLTIHAISHPSWEIEHVSSHLPAVEACTDHFIYQIAKQTADAYDAVLPPCHLTIKSDIPLTRGLGSSASAIIAGIELANQLCELDLSSETKLMIAQQIEGHPDNVAPALYGGLVLAVLLGERIETFQMTQLPLEAVLSIPATELPTKDARKVLPDSYPRSIATKASAISSLMVAALLNHDFSTAGNLMEHDLFHEPYRSKLIPCYDGIRSEAKQLGAFSTVISGAGPTLISFVPTGTAEQIAATLGHSFSDFQIKPVQIDTQGLNVELIG
ncbi:homoserine kinase [Ornithinibacillus gellani]|uniref:homoserine kinase n=1 Tax=Ornithinibacillus gellani TaxID=2293253 RepID=UPI000F4A7DB2|nr:homoserine kinase [Ornithinibacillus gellani]TQS71023.1 homoserine kinase [Ornithinibacillus gellani]